MGKLARISWPQEYSELQRIEELLLCGICYDYMDTSVMTPCSHNYCSLCIRKYLHYKTQCPACFEKTFEKDLHTNRILDELVSYFSKIREKLVNCVTGAKIIANEENESIDETTSTTPVRPARTNQSVKKPSPKIAIERSQIFGDNMQKVEKIQPFVPEQQKTMYSPSTSGVSKVAKIFTPKGKKNLSNVTTSGKNVPCPVCRVDVSEFHINKHLDDCLKRETVTQQPARIDQKRKPLPKLVFSLMKDAELRKKMKELGLPSQGDRKTLESRFHRYSTLYNAECDKIEPRPTDELLRQCENDENLEKKMLKFAQAANRLKVTRNCDQNIIEDAQKKYLETNRQNYHSLIASIKERDKNRKISVRRSLIDEDSCSNVQSSSQNIENIVNNHTTDCEDDPSCYSMNAYEATFQDSDSNSSCPLQHYASDDPMKYLSFKMSISDNSITPTKTPLKSEIHENQGKNEDSSLDAPFSPIKSTTLCDTKNDIEQEEFSRNNDIYCATTDNETSDEDIVNPSPIAETCHTTKRAKLTIREKIRDNDDKIELEENQLKGQILAMSIARDFTYDTSSNDSVETEALNDERTSDKAKMGVQRSERTDMNISNRDKENHESFATACSPVVVNRPLRKRNCKVRSENLDTADSARSNEKTTPTLTKATTTTTTTISNDVLPRSNEQEDEKLSCNSRIESPLKRRRRRKVTTNETETINPPRRPLRKRLVNSVSTANSRK